MCALEYARVCPGQVTSDLTRKRRRPSRAAHRQCGESRAETPALALRGVEKLRKCRCALRHALRSAGIEWTRYGQRYGALHFAECLQLELAMKFATHWELLAGRAMILC